MGELGEARWALMSERGCEALALTYAEALELESRLRSERVSGLCVITDAAGRRLPLVSKPSRKAADGDSKGRARRPAKRKQEGS